jgi:acylphosphatase
LSLVRRRVVVQGRVQGVGFRMACERAARVHQVAGWVRNRRDGRVEAVFEGEAAGVAAVVQWCWEGPPGAAVTGLEVVDEQPEGLTGFRVATTG